MSKRGVVLLACLAVAAFSSSCSPGTPTYSGPSTKQEVAQAIHERRHDPRGGVEGPKLSWRDGDFDLDAWLESQQRGSESPTYLLGMMFDSEVRNYVDRAQKSGGGSVRFLRGQFQGGSQNYQECYIELTLEDLRAGPATYDLIGSAKTFRVRLPEYYYEAFLEHVEERSR
jgi:hypothetical protein